MEQSKKMHVHMAHLVQSERNKHSHTSTDYLNLQRVDLYAQGKFTNSDSISSVPLDMQVGKKT